MDVGHLRMDSINLADGTHLTVFVLAPVMNVEHEARVQDYILLSSGTLYFTVPWC